MAAELTYAFGLRLRLTTTEHGGRTTALAGGAGPDVRFRYRPNWGLPHMTPPEQTGAHVLGFSDENVRPGDTVRAVVVPPFPQMADEWARVRIGDELPMYEGARVCGYGEVLWRQETRLPLPPEDEWRFRAWVIDPGAPDELDVGT